MTPTEQDKKLREKLDEILERMAFRCAGGITNDGRKEYEPARDAIIDLILSDVIKPDACTCGCNFGDGCLCQPYNELRAVQRLIVKGGKR